MEQHYSVLLVDDDKFLVDMYAVKFGEKGLKVESSLGAKEAIDKLRDGYAPDIILLDLVMPNIDGFEFLETMQKEKLAPHAKKVVLSNQGQDDEIERARQLGADDYIIKASAIPSEVLDKVIRILGS